MLPLNELTTDELRNLTIASLDEAVEVLAYTRDNDGIYLYDAGHDEPWEACEATCREAIQNCDFFTEQADRTEDTNSEYAVRIKEEMRLYKAAHTFILNDILARENYIPLAQQPELEWKRKIRTHEIDSLDAALFQVGAYLDGNLLVFVDPEEVPNVFTRYDCALELQRLKTILPDTDEGIYFHPYHDIRRSISAYKILLAEMKTSA